MARTERINNRAGLKRVGIFCADGYIAIAKGVVDQGMWNLYQFLHSVYVIDPLLHPLSGEPEAALANTCAPHLDFRQVYAAE